MPAMTSDYAQSTGDPSPYLRRIAAAGFSHVHWCHHWNTDFLYARCEIEQIASWLKDFGLALLALHGSVGPEKDWAASAEYRRRAGVELVLNRLEMAARLESDVVIMHAAASISAATDGVSPWEALRRSLDELEPCARRLGVRIAIENGDWPTIRALLSAYSPDFLGLCYDSGHGNVDGNGLTELAAVKERLIAIHLHDNNGHEDEHRLPFTGTVDWAQLAEIIASSAYVKCISLESTIHKEKVDSEETFLAQAFLAAQRLSAMVETARGKEIA